MSAGLHTPGVADAVVSAPSVGDVLAFAGYVVGLIGTDRVERVSVELGQVYVIVTDTLAADAAVHLLGLAPILNKIRHDLAPSEHSPEGYTAWTGKSGAIEVRLTGPLALGGLPERRPYEPLTTSDDAPAVA